MICDNNNNGNNNNGDDGYSGNSNSNDDNFCMCMVDDNHITSSMKVCIGIFSMTKFLLSFKPIWFGNLNNQ